MTDSELKDTTHKLLCDLLDIYMNTDENGEPKAPISKILNVWNRIAQLKQDLELASQEDNSDNTQNDDK